MEFLTIRIPNLGIGAVGIAWGNQVYSFIAPIYRFTNYYRILKHSFITAMYDDVTFSVGIFARLMLHCSSPLNHVVSAARRNHVVSAVRLNKSQL